MAGIEDNQHIINQLQQTNELHCVYGDQEFVLEDTTMYCSDDTKAIYYLTDNQAILLHDVDNQLTSYYIDENSEILGNQNEAFTLDGTEIVQFVQQQQEEDGDIDDNDNDNKQEIEQQQQIIYYTNDNTDINNINFTIDDTTSSIINSLQDADGNIYPLKQIMLEGPIFEYDDDIDDNNTIKKPTDNIQYAILQDNLENNTTIEPELKQHKLEIEEEERDFETVKIEPNIDDKNIKIDNTNNNIDDNNDDDDEEYDDGGDMIDLSKITGRNLITGQIVTLHSYMEKLKRKLNANNINDLYKKTTTNNKNGKICKIDGLLDKKIPIGTTKNGKKIVGKIVHIGKKINENNSDDDDNNNNNNNSSDNNSGNNIKKTIITTKENLEQISKTLSGVMEMQSVRKKLENKNLIIKLIERNYITNTVDDYYRKTSYCYGYMFKFDKTNDRWKFITSTTTENDSRFPTTTSLTIVITNNKNGTKSVRVNLNNLSNNLCNLCMKQFKNVQQLRQHLLTIHNQKNDGEKQILLCEICGEIFNNFDKLTEHKLIHNINDNIDNDDDDDDDGDDNNDNKLFVCNECNKCFTTNVRLQKHLNVHDLYSKPLECTLCNTRCSNEWSLKKHLLIHTGIRPYSCDICNKQFTNECDVTFHKRVHFPDKQYTCNVCMRSFSRYSNLIRHTRIHKGAVYTCEICYCSYNYMSSLTRHMVHSHLDVKDIRKQINRKTV